MKVFNLGCAQSHVFEGWFGSEADYQSQQERGLLECPLCGDKTVEKRPSAPRLNLRAQDKAPAARATAPGTAAPAMADTQSAAPPDAVQMQAAMLRAWRELGARSEDVGERFAEEARRIHHGEVNARSIRGRASMADAVDLLEEGIAVLPLPDLPVLKETLQ